MDKVDWVNASSSGDAAIAKRECYKCIEKKSILFKCRYDEKSEWMLVCGRCHYYVQKCHSDTYQYAGIWRARPTDDQK